MRKVSVLKRQCDVPSRVLNIQVERGLALLEINYFNSICCKKMPLLLFI